MKNNKKSKLFPIAFISVAVLLVAVIVFVRLGNNGDDNSDNPDYLHRSNQGSTNVQTKKYNDYMYLAGDRIMYLDTGNAVAIDGLVAKGEMLYYIYVDYINNPNTQDMVSSGATWNSNIAVVKVKGINKSGETIKNIEIHMNRSFNGTIVLGFDINDAEEITIITREFEVDIQKDDIYHSRYDSSGNLLSRNLLSDETDWFAHKAYISKDGYIAIVGYGTFLSNSIRIWDKDLTYIKEETEVNTRAFIFTDKDTYLSTLHGQDEPGVIQKVDIFTGELIMKHNLDFHISSIHLAEKDSCYDYYFVTTQHLYGFFLETGETEIVIDFLESGINLEGMSYFAIFDDGSVAVTRERMNNQTNLFQVELVVLSPVHRSEIEDSNIVVLAGFNITNLIGEQVIDYNRKNPGQQIVVRDYYNWDIVDYDEMKRQAEERYHFDIISGNTPDIMMFARLRDFDTRELRDSLIRQGYLADLYPFIDGNPILNRDAFFPNILKGYEDKNGKLMSIGNRINISTMIYTDPLLQTDYWTFDSFITLMENDIKAGKTMPLDSDLTGIHFLMTLLDLLSNEFIDYDLGNCNFDSEKFIRLLELTAKIPDNVDRDNHTTYNPSLHRMFNGEQTVDVVFLSFLDGWVTEFLHGEASADLNYNYRYIGLPSASNSSHNAELPITYSIFENSKHKDAAWQFIQEMFLSESDFNSQRSGYFSLFINEFENNLSTTTLSEQGKNVFRNIVNTASVQRPLSNTIKMIVEEEVDAFLRGQRSATDIARIIQSRVSIYLSERS
ncbi:MAG: extracellular solute-binding protein [Oscillospiraceae bacterium]|jgi:ABC-type glycerol-3-phosphate transport system substrate-binding protein|nr:extracellular solute-binding protein [Oscillospiraceae bacterium]